MTSKDGSDQGGNAEGQEVDGTGRTPLHTVRIDLLDDGVRDHGSTRSHTEYQQSKPGWRQRWHEVQLDDTQQHQYSAPYQRRFAPMQHVSQPTDQRAAENPTQGNHRSGEHSALIAE